MTRWKNVVVAALLVSLIFVASSIRVSGSNPASPPALPRSLSLVFLPLLSGGAGPVPTSSAIIVDHTTTNLASIPDSWITQAKTDLRVSYGHTSHGSQPITGMSFLKDALHNYSANGAVQPGVLSIADYTPSGDLGNPDRVTWATLTRNYLGGSGSSRNVVAWAWCGQVSSASATDINTYLSLMSQLEHDFPNVRFVYFTGHLDGSGPTGNLYVRNNQIRDYVRSNGKILYDFADIESYDPAGNYYPNESDGCVWCTNWCATHAADCAALTAMSDCAHSHKLNCRRKAEAFWWLMARLAGWPGPTS